MSVVTDGTLAMGSIGMRGKQGDNINRIEDSKHRSNHIIWRYNTDTRHPNKERSP